MLVKYAHGGGLTVDWKGLIEAAKAKSTIDAYKRWIQRYEAFVREAGLDPLDPMTVGVWIDHLAGAYKIATIAQALAAVGFYFSLHRKVPPGKATEVRLLMQALRRQKGAKQRRAAPILPSHLINVRWDKDIKGVRDRALVFLMLAGALRVSEAIQLHYEDLEFVPEGVILTIRKSKTDQVGAGRQVAIPRLEGALCPVRALEAYLAIRGRGGGPLFQSIHNMHLTARPLTRSAVHYIVKDLADRIGLDPQKYSSHSMRAGLATAAALRGATLQEIAGQTGHKSLEVLGGYIRRANLFQLNPVAKAFAK